MAQVEIIAANLKQNVINSVKKIIKRVCAYARVSTDSEEQLTSYSSQIKHYSEKIKSNPDWEFVGIYAEMSLPKVSTIGSAVIEPPPNSSDSFAERSRSLECR